MALQVRDIVQYTDPNGVKRLGQVIRDNLDSTYQVQLYNFAGNPDGPALAATEGTSVNQASLFNQGGYRDIFDIDLSALGNQTFPSDLTNIVFAGKTGWNMINSANCTTVTQNIAGTGLQFNPASTSNIANPRTAPALGCPIQVYYPAYNYLTDSLRFWAYNATDNIAANFDHAYAGFWSHTGASDNFVCVGMRGFFSGANSLRARELFKGTVTDAPMSQNLGASNRVIMCELTANHVRYFYGQISGDGSFPALSSLAFAGAIVFSGAFSWDNPTTPPASSDMCFGVGSLRAGGVTNLILTFKRIKLQVATL